MENKMFSKSVSMLLVVVMVMSVFGVITMFDGGAYADTTAKKQEVKSVSSNDAFSALGDIKAQDFSAATVANPAYNSVSIPNELRYGQLNYVYANGHRYTEVYNKFVNYVNLCNSGDITNISMFTNGEEYYEMASMKLEKKGFYPRTFTNYHSNTRMAQYYGVEIGKTMPAGKYTLTTTYRKCNVSATLNSVDNPTYSTVRLNAVPNSEVSQTSTFYIKSKVKFSNSSKKGKLAKAKKTKYLTPGKKYGKLPKPKAKKGYKFKGWYTKKSGGKKVKKTTKVPTKNTITLYARYVKK